MFIKKRCECIFVCASSCGRKGDSQPSYAKYTCSDPLFFIDLGGASE